MAHVLILYKLKPGVAREDFEDWLRTNNVTALRGIKRLKDFAVYRVEKRVMSPGEPSTDYFDLLRHSRHGRFRRRGSSKRGCAQGYGRISGFRTKP